VVGRPHDLDDYEQLVREHQVIAFRTAYVITGSAADAEEVVQDAFVKAYRARGRFRAGAPFRPWLLTIVANEARNRRRAAGRRSALALRAAAEPAAPVPLPDAAALAGSERAELAAALARLGPEHREVITLRFLLDLSEAECAAAIGCRPGTVKSRLSRALGRLRLELEGSHA
jgi:RNA polymerase sigma factor (sigma-70 family)